MPWWALIWLSCLELDLRHRGLGAEMFFVLYPASVSLLCFLFPASVLECYCEFSLTGNATLSSSVFLWALIRGHTAATLFALALQPLPGQGLSEELEMCILEPTVPRSVGTEKHLCMGIAR